MIKMYNEMAQEAGIYMEMQEIDKVLWYKTTTTIQVSDATAVSLDN